MKEGYFVHKLFLFGLVMLEVGCTYSDAQCSPASDGVKRFGAKCQFRCHCLDGEQCDVKTGACPSECSYNWTGPSCQYNAHCTPASGGVKRFGTNCQFRCHCLDGEQCDVDTGACPSGCNYNWTGPFCQYKNIALGAESRFSDNMYPPQYSFLANDRDIKSCSFTGGPTTRRKIAPWWAIWFSHHVVFNELVFTTKEEYLRYFPEFNVTVQKNVTKEDHRAKKVHEGELCFRQNKTIPDKSTVHVKCTMELVGNQLRLQLANTFTQLVICDLRISGVCRDRTWGADCKNECGFCYNLSQCDSNNGSCTRCEVGYIPTPTCTEECKDGYFGENCSKNCGTNCRKKSGKKLCHHVSGICLHGCNAGWQGDLCKTECDDGFFGENCSQNCGTNCQNNYQENICHHVSGVCLQGCNAGWQGDHCETECEDGYYGVNCSQTCGTNCQNNYQENICHHVSGACLQGCKAGWQGVHCETECNKGTFGKDCSNRCYKNCKNGVCNKETGECIDGCKPGYTGHKCEQECREGYFGENCSEECGNNCQKKQQGPICNSINGVCLHGCNAGWQGDRCQTGCEDGYFGVNCSQICGRNCLSNSEEKPCHHINGSCLHGCIAGWQGDLCQTECSYGYWGENCLRACGKCLSGSCDTYNGSCSGICQPGYKYKIYCDEECETGWFGNNCSNKCSSDCKDLSFCRKSDGLCVTGSSRTEIFVVVGGGIALAVIVTVVVVSIIWFRRHLQSRRTPYETNTNINIGSDSGNGFPDTASGVKSTSNTYEELQTGMRMEHEYDAL